ncbi:E3 ubiquitin/ISG15 ligase TRIM25-like isoform X1 [Hippoglossus hippoglossus]|uniref:E3 ubiquitin/ISG15 ligase TRIM25-like isoform X1 n=1 Tax=Hippoglossus hippoglossus TaxID=8267 RepID=UPI00148C02E7|nr:E3 ubiquitin/ISG15 ligase TRIM25-like isoform X1 [Hippoglossus hippoglossus]
MAQQENQLDRERFCCSICLDLLKDPVTTVCGHSYCKSCINTHWDKEEERGSYSCPQCRQTFTPRPVLGKSTMLADSLEELKKTGLQAAPADHCYAGPEDVACDVCTGRKLKALKSCLVCLASYCEKHLQPHLQSAPFMKHKLVEPSEKLQENICSRHDEVMKMFCRTDQQCICYLCSVEEHKDHDTVSAAAERTERQRELGLRRQTIQQRVQDREKDVKLLQQEEEAVNGSADKAVEDSEKIFTELIRLLEKRSSDVKQQIRSQEVTEVSRVRELQERLEQEITELKEIKTEDTDTTTDDDKNTLTHADTLGDINIKTEKHTHSDCEEHTHTWTRIPEPRPGTEAECQLNLLEHVESFHHQISARMDLIERELDVLESWLDHSGELEPPDPLSRLPQLKQRMRRLLRDLCTVRRLSVCR